MNQWRLPTKSGVERFFNPIEDTSRWLSINGMAEWGT